MANPKHILVIRFSSMGDVAMTVPVIKNALQQNPGLEVTVVSNAFFAPVFKGLEGCHFYPAFLKERHKGIGGMYRLFNELRSLAKFDAVADLHNVLRSQVLRSFFRLTGVGVQSVDKGRNEKKALTRKENKVFRQLTSTHERYAMVFKELGLQLQLDHRRPVYLPRPVPAALESVFHSGKRIIGVAPFAQYAQKTYPLEKMKSMVQQLAGLNDTVLLFGGRKREAAVLQQWELDIFSVFNVAGRYSLEDELAIISNLSLMVSMDSANMHLASLFDVPVVSIWGATHPFAGFYGWGQAEQNIAQIDLYCRPCSVFGNKPCYRGDLACMHQLPPEIILQKIAGVDKD